jgi:AmmeMemoRadiSam system protein A
MDLGANDRQRLLRLARCSIQDALHHDGSLARALSETQNDPALSERRGVFVTLKLQEPENVGGMERLRGCIGHLAPEATLVDAVVELAPRAAFEDPRFAPLERGELLRVRISISILTPPRRLDDVDQLELGRDGVQLVQGPRHSVFLPQVAAEQGWSVTQLLDQLALKAGMPRDGWRDAERSSFRAEVFSE